MLLINVTVITSAIIFYFCYTCCPDLTPCFLLLWLLGAIELWELLEEKYCLGSVAKPVEHDDVVTSVSVNSSVAKFVSTGYDKTWVLPCNIFIIVSVSCVMPWLCWVNGLFKKVHFCTFVIYMQVWPLWLTQYWIIFTCHVCWLVLFPLWNAQDNACHHPLCFLQIRVSVAVQNYDLWPKLLLKSNSLVVFVMSAVCWLC